MTVDEGLPEELRDSAGSRDSDHLFHFKNATYSIKLILTFLKKNNLLLYLKDARALSYPAGDSVGCKNLGALP